MALLEETSIHTAKMTSIKVALKEIHKRENKRWVIYTDSQSYMQSIEYNRENHSILNQIYNILAELQAQDRKIILCKVPEQMRIEGIKEVDKKYNIQSDIRMLLDGIVKRKR